MSSAASCLNPNLAAQCSKVSPSRRSLDRTSDLSFEVILTRKINSSAVKLEPSNQFERIPSTCRISSTGTTRQAAWGLFIAPHLGHSPELIGMILWQLEHAPFGRKAYERCSSVRCANAAALSAGSALRRSCTKSSVP
jgi:hypothetical protein